MSDLTELANIGPVLAEKLAQIGIQNYEGLAALGSIEAVLRIGAADDPACYNMLYALEGAIRGMRWYGIPKEERRQLKEELERARGK